MLRLVCGRPVLDALRDGQASSLAARTAAKDAAAVVNEAA